MLLLLFCCALAHDCLLRKTQSSWAKIALSLNPSSGGSNWIFPLYYFQILYHCSSQIKSYILYTLVVKILRVVCSFPLLLICMLVVGCGGGAGVWRWGRVWITIKPMPKRRRKMYKHTNTDIHERWIACRHKIPLLHQSSIKKLLWSIWSRFRASKSSSYRL